jgi:hypothetical protein
LTPLFPSSSLSLCLPTRRQFNRGDRSGGARHQSASALAQLDGGNVVIKASEDVCKSGEGCVDVFFATKLSVKIQVPRA